MVFDSFTKHGAAQVVGILIDMMDAGMLDLKASASSELTTMKAQKGTH